MAANNKRLDLRFGAFACSVQGFDDPVVPVQQVLRAIQHLLEESPDIADAGISFDAETIESLIEEVSRRADVNTSDLEITPGLVIVYHGEGRAPQLTAPVNAAPAPTPARKAAAHTASGASRDHPAGGGVGRPAAIKAEVAFADEPESAAEPEEDDTYDEFAGADPVEIDSEESEGDLVSELFAARLRRSIFDAPSDAEIVPAEGAPAPTPSEPASEESPAPRADAPAPTGRRDTPPEPARDIFAPPASTGGDIFGAPAAQAEADAGAPGEPDTSDAAENVFAAPHEHAQDADPSVGTVNLFGNFLTGEDYSVDLPAQDTAPEEVPLVLGGDKAAVAEEDDPHTVAGLAKLSGATAVPEMMVSAAAWMVLFKGQSSFTRREVMDVFDRIPGDHQKSLEVRIKGFGKAVRNGQIVMVEDGVFGLSKKEMERFQGLL